MARALVEVSTADGVARFEVEADELVGVGPERVSRSGVAVARLNGTLDEALASARPAAEAVINAFKELTPDEISVEFGLSIDAEAGAVFAKAGVGAHFTVSLRWQPGAAAS